MFCINTAKRRVFRRWLTAGFAVAVMAASPPAYGQQKGQIQTVSQASRVLQFDWPAIGKPIKSSVACDDNFYVDSRYRTRISFVASSKTEKLTRTVINPARWALIEQRSTADEHGR